MAEKKRTDVFSNVAHATVTQSAADTLTFGEINTGISIHEKVAWVIHRIQWFPTIATLQLIAAAADELMMSLVLSSKITDIADLSDPVIVDHLNLATLLHGAAGNHTLQILPITRDFSQLAGGGLIISPKPLYVAVDSVSLGTAAIVGCRLYYTTKDLSTDEFWELVQASRIVE